MSMTHRYRALPTLAAGGAALLLAGGSAPALALDCLDYALRGSLPVDGAADQPLNARVTAQVYTFTDPEYMAVSLREADSGAEVPAALETVHVGTTIDWQFVPTEPLAPLTRYRLEIRDASKKLRDTVTFTTGAGLDEEAPSAPSILSAESSLDTDTWGDWYRWQVEIAPATDPSGVYYLLELASDEAFTEPTARYSMTASANLDDSPCSTDPAAKLDADVTWLRVSAIDAAGNVSATTAFAPPGPDDTGTGDDTGKGGDTGEDDPGEKGCSAVGGGRAAGALSTLALLAGLAAGLRRRPRILA